MTKYDYLLDKQRKALQVTFPDFLYQLLSFSPSASILFYTLVECALYTMLFGERYFNRRKPLLLFFTTKHKVKTRCLILLFAFKYVIQLMYISIYKGTDKTFIFCFRQIGHNSFLSDDKYIPFKKLQLIKKGFFYIKFIL